MCALFRYCFIVQPLPGRLTAELSIQDLMAYGPGGYHFTNFLKVGVPMNIAVTIPSIGLIPLIWPVIELSFNRYESE